MKTSQFVFLLAVLIGFAALSSPILSQPPAEVAPAGRDMVLEVTYFKGRTFSYQRPGEWTWYEMFQRPADWKPRAGEVPVAAVKLTPRLEDGVFKVRVTVLRGRNHETEEFVAEYKATAERKIPITELTALGVEPFEIQLVRAPSTVAEPPAVINKTRSVEVSVEPAQASLPTFVARFLNNSQKPIAALAVHTSIDGARKLSAMPSQEGGGVLIQPGGSYEKRIRYPMKLSNVSTGEVPPAAEGLVLNLTSVIFMDGSYEGDPLPAANYLAVNFGEKEQLRRFVDQVRARASITTSEILAAPTAQIDVDSLTADFMSKFPVLSAEQKGEVRKAIDFGRSRAVKFLSSIGAEPPAAVIERMQSRIAVLP